MAPGSVAPFPSNGTLPMTSRQVTEYISQIFENGVLEPQTHHTQAVTQDFECAKAWPPSPPRAMLTQISVTGFAKFIPSKPLPPGHAVVPCHGSTLQIGGRGTRADRKVLQFIHLRRFAKFIPSTVPGHGLNGSMMARMLSTANVYTRHTQITTMWPARSAERFPWVSLGTLGTP